MIIATTNAVTNTDYGNPAIQMLLKTRALIFQTM